MIGLIARRLVATVALLFLVTIVIFTIFHVAGGTIVPGVTEGNASGADLDRIRKTLGLDRPAYVQYMDWLGISYLLHAAGSTVAGGYEVAPGLLEGNLGRSLISGELVFDRIAAALPATLILSVTSLAVGVALAIPL